MSDLELVGLHADGEHLVLIDPDGGRHRLPIDDALRAAVRRDRTGLEQLRTSAVRPRDIQVMVRAGADAQEVAERTGTPVEQVRRYEGPVLAERAHVAQRAQAMPVGHEEGSPSLGDLVVDRLAGRSATGLRWDACRTGHEPWQVVARFTAGGREREAMWEVDVAAGTLRALDDESQWLSETDLAATGRSRHLTAVAALSPDPGDDTSPYDVEAEPDSEIVPALRAVDAESLLDGLDAARGVRQPVDDADELGDEEDDGLGAAPMLWEDPPGAHPAASRPQEAADATVLRPLGPVTDAAGDPGEPGDPEGEEAEGMAPAAESAGSGGEQAHEPENARPRRSRRSRRASVPSWDEIVFGARND